VYGFVEVDIDWYLSTLEKYLNTFKTLLFAKYLNTLNKYLLQHCIYYNSSSLVQERRLYNGYCNGTHEMLG